MSGSRCQTLYPFSGERHRQGLRFAAGELITVLQVPDGGWWEGQKEDGLRGWFPASYVQLLEQKPRKATPQTGEDTLNSHLPPGWQSYMSPQGRRYYVNTFTNAGDYEGSGHIALVTDGNIASQKGHEHILTNHNNCSLVDRGPASAGLMKGSVLQGSLDQKLGAQRRKSCCAEAGESSDSGLQEVRRQEPGRFFLAWSQFCKLAQRNDLGTAKQRAWDSKEPCVAEFCRYCLVLCLTTALVNGYHVSGTPVHQLDSGHMSLRKSSGGPQAPGSPAAPRRQSKESSLTINCVTFPHPDVMPEQQLLKPSEWSYCDYFWADKKDSQGNNTVSGFEILLQKQLKGKQMQKEMAEFVRERIKIEEEYAKNLSKLSQNSLAAQEEGTLGEAWAQLKKSLADEAEVHLKFSSKLQSEVEKPLLNFRENFKKDMKKCDHHIADLRKHLASRYAAVEKARKALTERQKDLEMKTQQLEVKLSNKTEEEIKKARRKSTQAGDDLMRCVDLYNQAQSKWFEEMVTTTLELERLEVERVEMIRQHLCQYTQLRHETDMFNQSTVELVDQLLRKVDPAKDRELWVKEHKTGDIRPVDMEI
ncbi:hypothetical protein Q9233_013987 [Columba guinea]|nr:hypothetical protein Q9233_013987 [Columba guinea]